MQQLATIHVPVQTFEGIVGLEQGFMRGSIWSNLYYPYKYEMTVPPRGMDQRQNTLFMVDIYAFAITELSEFLDTHPNDARALETYNKIKVEYDKAVSYYEKNFGPLSIYSGSTTTYDYIKGPWPWEDRF